MIGIRLKEADSEASRCRDINAAAAVWSSSLTVQQKRHLQRVEHRAVAAFSEKREDPVISCSRLGLEPLEERRRKLCMKFAKSTVEKSRHGDMFKQDQNGLDRSAS